MDLYNDEKNRIKMYANIRYQDALAHNERVTALRKQAAQRILNASEDEKQDMAQQGMEEIATGSAAGISTAIDATSARTTLMNAAKKKGEEALKQMAKEKVDSVVKKTLNPLSKDIKTEAADESAGEVAKSEGKAVAAEGEVAKSGDRIIGRKFTRKALGAGGTFMNVGQGAYDLYKDTDGFKGDFHLEGANDLEKASNALQMASAVADTLGVVTAQPEIIALGAALGAASAVTGAIGGEEEIEKKGEKQKASLEAKKSQIRSDMDKLKMVSADRVRDQALRAGMSSLGIKPRVATSAPVVQKVAA